MSERQLSLEAGTRIELTSLRTRRKLSCQIGGVLGEGGTASVYEGVLEDGSLVVIKSQRFAARGADYAIEVEIELFKKLFHRNVVHCVGVGVAPSGQLLIAFRRAYPNPLLLMTQKSVDEGMRRDKKARYPSLPLDTAIDMGYELLNALAYLERLGFVHHDVKLANLLIDVPGRGRPLSDREVFGHVVRRTYRGVLIDFGATRSRAYLTAWTQGERPEGITPQITPFYAPPEALVEARREDGSLGLVFDPSLDVYAAALVIYAMITGYPPYTHLKAPPDPVDLESVISVKSAERRGEVTTISGEVIRRVVFEDTKFLEGGRAAFDLALERFLLQRLAPDPAVRGTAAQMKRDFERLTCIRPAARDASTLQRGAQRRVFLPFLQELVEVGGSAGKHPLVRAARLSGLAEGSSEARRRLPASASGRVEPRSGTGRVEPLSGTGRVEPLSGTGRVEPLSGTGRVEPLSGTGRVEQPVSDSGTTDRRGATRRSLKSGLDWLDDADSRDQPTDPAVARRGPRRAPASPSPSPSSLEADATRHRPPRRAGLPPGASERPPPPSAVAEAPHCLLSPILDSPLLLARSHRYLVGRDPAVDIRIKSDLVSRRHAEVYWKGDGFVVQDLGSLNATTLNGKPLERPTYLLNDDRLGFGGFEFKVKVLTDDWRVEQREGQTRILQGPEDRTTSTTPAFAGDMTQLSLKDVVQMLEWKRHWGTLTVEPAEGGRGFLYVHEGRVVHAEGRGCRGLEAAIRLLGTRLGRFSFAPGRPPCPRTIECSPEEIWKLVRGRRR